MTQNSTTDRPAPDVHVPYWPLWLACFLGYAAIGMTIQVMPAYANDRLDANTISAGMAVTIGSLATMIARPIVGRIADQHGARGVVMAGSLLALAGGLGHLVATSMPALVLARLLLGAGEGALFTAAIGWILVHAEPTRRGKIAGHFGLSMWGGLATGPVSRVIFPKAAWLPGAVNVFASIGYGVIAAFLVPHFEARHLAGRDLVLAAFGLAFMIARFLGSPAVDRFGARRVLMIALTIQAAGLAGIYFASTTGPVFVGTVLTGAGLSMLFPCVTILVTAEADARERSAAMGAMISAWDFGLAIGGPLGGVVAGATDAGPFMLGAGAALIAIVPLLWRRTASTPAFQE